MSRHLDALQVCFLSSVPHIVQGESYKAEKQLLNGCKGTNDAEMPRGSSTKPSVSVGRGQGQVLCVREGMEN